MDMTFNNRQQIQVIHVLRRMAK